MSLRKLLAAIMVVSMVLGLVGTSALAAESEQWDSATVLLQQFGIVTGDASGDLRLNDNITRAEMVKVLVAAAGAEELANLLKGAPSFTDVAADAWYSGYVAFAKNAGITGGYADGTFQPEAQVTYAEVVAFLAKFLGVEPVAGAEWPNNYIQAFENAGLAAEGLNLAEFANAPAVRGWVFTLADNAFRYGGAESVYAYLDGEAPELTVDAVAGTTEATKVTVSGKVSGAEALFVNDAAVEVGADGSFSAEVALAVGANSILVKAVDEVGLEAVKTVEVTRTLAPAASIEAEAITVEAGQTVDVAVKVLDQNGEVIADAEVSGESEVGTFAAGKFTAGEKAGTGTLTLKYGELSKSVAVTVKAGALAKLEVTPSADSVAPGDKVTFEVKGYDALGNEVSGFTPTFSDDSANALTDGATGDFIASESGTYTVTASVGEIKGTATIGVYGDVADVKVSAPATLVANNKTEATVTVTAVDENGNKVVADGEIIVDFDATALTIEDSEGNGVADNGTVDVTDGVATLTVVANANAAGVISDFKVTWNDDDDDKYETAEIELLEQVATGVKFLADDSDKYLVANLGGEKATLVFAVVDQEGEVMASGDEFDVTFEVTGPADVVDADTDDFTTDGKAEVVVESSKSDEGTVTVTATIEGLGSASGTVQAAVAGDPEKVAVTVEDNEAEANADDADNVNSIKIVVTDKKGVPVAGQYRFTVEFSDDAIINVDAGDSVTETQDPDDDTVWTLEMTAEAASVLAEFQSNEAADYTAKVIKVEDIEANPDVDLELTSGEVAFSFVPGDLDSVEWDLDYDVATLLSPRENKATLKLQLVDAKGNAVAKSGVELTLEETTEKILLNGEKGETTVETDAEGVASVELTALSYLGDYTVSVTKINEDAVDVDTTVTVVSILPDEVKLTLTNAAGDGFSWLTAGSEINLGVTIEDENNIELTPTDIADIEDHLVIDVEDDIFGLDNTFGAEDPKADDGADLETLLSWNGTDEEYQALLYGIAAGRQTVTVKLVGIGGKDLKAAKSFIVKAGEPDHAIVADAAESDIAEGKLAVTEGEVTSYVLKLTDVYDNPVSVNSAKTVGVAVYTWTDGVAADGVVGDGDTLTDTTDIQVREAEGGTAVESVDTKSAKTIYLVGNEENDATYVLAVTLDDTTVYYELEYTE